MTTEVPGEILARLREACLRLPEAYEEQAWVGTRWRVGKKTFAHVLVVEGGRPPAYARAAGTSGPAVVLTFRSSGEELAALGGLGHPFFRPPWFPDIVGMVVEDDVDWSEVTELLAESYRHLAPRRLAERLDPPPGR
uniref:MmcQ/YjbR family DNA-binding protein n=1 Tax=Microbispora cellulosiformans TaxID=2614688 RepID=UPI001CD9EEB8|nr:MmcQ/YjbR family DNA-binding protein [Microbispora cellulosiformans]